MSILIKGMEMPKSSRRCPFTEMDDWGMRCTVGGKYEWHKDRLCDECPLVPVPPHGRLIDADALLFECNTGRIRPGESFVTRTYVNDAPTIIEAEGRET